jgi:hypothetical protein
MNSKKFKYKYSASARTVLMESSNFEMFIRPHILTSYKITL